MKEGAEKSAAVFRFRLAAAAAAVVLGLAGCGEKAVPEPAADQTVVALVNSQAVGLEVFRERLAAQAALVGGDRPPQGEAWERLKEEVLARLIEETLLLQRARALGLTVADGELDGRIAELRSEANGEAFQAQAGAGGAGFPAWREQLRRRLILERLVAREVNAGIVVDEAEARRHYEANRKAYETPRRVRAAQIVIRDAQKAGEILKRLKAGEDFGKVARDASIGPEAVRGGDLGFFERGRMPEAIDRVVFALPPGRLSGVVQSPYGYHIFKVLERQEAGGRTFAEARERVTDDLRRLREAEAYVRWVEGLKAGAVVEVARPLPDLPQPAAARH